MTKELITNLRTEEVARRTARTAATWSLLLAVGACSDAPTSPAPTPGVALESLENSSVQATPRRNAPERLPNVVVGSGETLQIEAGSYGRVMVLRGTHAANSALLLSGGTFRFSELTLGDHSRIECLAPCVIEVAGTVRTGTGSFVGPAADVCASPADVKLVALGGAQAGDNAECPWEHVIDIGARSTVEANVAAPYGTIHVGNRSTLRADLSAQHVLLGKEVSVESAGTPFSLDDGNECTDDVCDPMTGQVTHLPTSDGAICDDENRCTQVDICQGGICIGGTAIICAASDSCHDTGICDPTTGVCGSNPVRPDGTDCKDSNVCTASASCQSGQCVRTPATDGSPCTDSNACTADACQSGECVSTPCRAPTPCSEATCDPATGCSYSLRDGVACGGGNLLGATCTSATDGQLPYGLLLCTQSCTLDAGRCGSEPPRVIVRCQGNQMGAYLSSEVDSYGQVTWRYFDSIMATGWLSTEQLASLRAAIAALETSTAGYTTSPFVHGNPHCGETYAVGSTGTETLAGSCCGGGGFGTCSISNDPAAVEVMKYGCADAPGKASWDQILQWWRSVSSSTM